MRRRSLFLASLAAPAIARAQGGAWPNRPVRIINPYAPGGTSDIILRPIAERLERAFGQPFIVENRAGAGGSVGTAAGAAAAPDGYTLLASNAGPLAVAPSLFPNLAYDPARSFAWIAMFGGAPIVCAVKADGPIRSLPEYLAAAKAKPEAVSFGSSGVGSTGHLTGVLFGLETGAQMLHIPFRGAQDAQTAVLSGQTDSLWDTSGANAAAIQAGTLRGLAVSTAERVAALPNLPTLIELGHPKVVSTNWFLLAGPVGLDPALAARIGGAVRDVLADAAIRQRLDSVGVVSLGTPEPAAIGAFVAEERTRWAAVVRAGKVTPG